MPDPTDQAEPAPRRTRRPSPLVIGTLIVVCGAAAVVYGMVPLGKKAQACPGGDAAVTRLDPLVHGEIAALSLAKPARLAPDLAFTGSDGKPLRLADFKGRTVLLNLWATWCVPCRQEMPALDKLQAKLGGADFEVVAVNVDTARLDRPKVFLKDAGVSNLAFYADPHGRRTPAAQG